MRNIRSGVVVVLMACNIRLANANRAKNGSTLLYIRCRIEGP